MTIRTAIHLSDGISPRSQRVRPDVSCVAEFDSTAAGQRVRMLHRHPGERLMNRPVRSQRIKAFTRRSRRGDAHHGPPSGALRAQVRQLGAQAGQGRNIAARVDDLLLSRLGWRQVVNWVPSALTGIAQLRRVLAGRLQHPALCFGAVWGGLATYRHWAPGRALFVVADWVE